jgi:AcrR family transcriptional regulator
LQFVYCNRERVFLFQKLSHSQSSEGKIFVIAAERFHNLPEEKKERILTVASEEFSQKGYAGASINSIVGRLGIAKGSLFQYFGTKDGLFRFVFSRALERVKGNLRDVRDNTRRRDLSSRLSDTLLAGAWFIRRHPLFYRLYLQLLSDNTIPFRNDMLLALRQYSLEYIRSLLEEAKQRGELADYVDLNRAAFMIDAVMDRFLQAQAVPHIDAGLGLFDGDMTDIQGWIKDMVQMIQKGVEKF